MLQSIGTRIEWQSEAEVISWAQKGSHEAWTEIYSRYYPVVFRYVKARVFDQAISEDISADVFVKALENIHCYRHRGRPFLAWLYRIARNEVVNYQRELQRAKRNGLKGRSGKGNRAPQSDPVADPTMFLGAGSKVDDPASVADWLDLKEALTKLTDSQREVIVLRFFLGLDVREVAAIMGKKSVAIYSLEARALESLLKRFGLEE